jgi:phosphomannomutase
MLLEALGCEIVQLYGEPTGAFPRPPEPTAENLTEICQVVRDRGADLGFAQDPDADRLAIVDHRGRYIGEEYTLVLAAKQILAARPGPIAVNLSSSRMIDDVAATAGSSCVVHRTPTGEANVVQAMKEHGCVMGGEGNGGVIDPRVVYVRDSLAGMALVLQLLTDEGAPLADVVGTFPRYEIVKTKFECSSDRAERMVAAAKKAFSGEMLDESDGLRIDWPDRWVQIRKSNTEPIVRIIAEGPTEKHARELVDRLRQIADAC